jgi:hypothetical protein
MFSLYFANYEDLKFLVNSKNLCTYRLFPLEELDSVSVLVVAKLPTKELNFQMKPKSLENFNPCSSVPVHI